MSIWCSRQSIGFDDWNDDDQPSPYGGQVRSFCTGWSNHYPTTDGEVEQEASIDTATIPVWCVPGHGEEFDERVGPWLRIGVDTVEHDYHNTPAVVGPVHVSIVMDEDAVRAFVAELTEWLDHDKAYPQEPTAS